MKKLILFLIVGVIMPILFYLVGKDDGYEVGYKNGCNDTLKDMLGRLDDIIDGKKTATEGDDIYAK